LRDILKTSIDEEKSENLSYTRSSLDYIEKRLGTGIRTIRMHMRIQVVNNFGVRFYDLFHVLRADLMLHPCRGTCNETLSLKLIRVQEVSYQGFSIVWLVRDVRDDENSRFVEEELGVSIGSRHDGDVR
jgi:hypothetical protein